MKMQAVFTKTFFFHKAQKYLGENYVHVNLHSKESKIFCISANILEHSGSPAEKYVVDWASNLFHPLSP